MENEPDTMLVLFQNCLHRGLTLHRKNGFISYTLAKAEDFDLNRNAGLKFQISVPNYDEIG